MPQQLWSFIPIVWGPMNTSAPRLRSSYRVKKEQLLESVGLCDVSILLYLQLVAPLGITPCG